MKLQRSYILSIISTVITFLNCIISEKEGKLSLINVMAYRNKRAKIILMLHMAFNFMYLSFSI